MHDIKIMKVRHIMKIVMEGKIAYSHTRLIIYKYIRNMCE